MSGGDDQRYPSYQTNSGMNPSYSYATYPAAAPYNASGYSQDGGRRRNDIGQSSTVPPPFTAAGQYTYTVPPGYVVAHSAGHWAPGDQQAQPHTEAQQQGHQHQPAAAHQSPSQTSHQQQWPQTYSGTYAPPSSSQPGATPSTSAAVQPVEHRGSYTVASPGVSSPQIAERARPPAALQQTRDRPMESPPTAASPGTGTGIDFAKLMDSTRFILESTSSAHGGQVQPEQLERMMDSADFAAQMLDAAVTQAPQAAPRPGEDDGGASAGKKRQKPDAPAQEGQVCLGCGATSTPEWRRGPMGPRTLCNACGLVYAKMIKKRARGPAGNKDRGKSGAVAAEDESDGSASDDESHGSPEHRSG